MLNYLTGVVQSVVNGVLTAGTTTVEVVTSVVRSVVGN